MTLSPGIFARSHGERADGHIRISYEPNMTISRTLRSASWWTNQKTKTQARAAGKTNDPAVEQISLIKKQKNRERKLFYCLASDNEMSVALMMAFLLTRVGCEARTALSAEKALRLAQTEMFDLITLDVDMPVSGFELFQSLKRIPHLRETPVVFVSGNATIENQQRGLNLGAADFIEKPFDSSDFVSRILSLVEESTTA